MLTISLNNASATQEFGRLGAELGELELRAAAIESKPEEKLIKELEQKVGAMGGLLHGGGGCLHGTLVVPFGDTHAVLADGPLHGREGVYMALLETPMLCWLMGLCMVGRVFTWYPGHPRSPFWRCFPRLN